MSFRTSLLVVVVAMSGAVGGAVLGYRVSQVNFELQIQSQDQYRLDQVRATRAIDFGNRLSTLRFLRKHNIPKDDITSMELGAIAFLQTIQLEQPIIDSASLVIVTMSSKKMADYRRDFPDSVFDPNEHAAVKALLSVKQ